MRRAAHGSPVLRSDLLRGSGERRPSLGGAQRAGGRPGELGPGSGSLTSKPPPGAMLLPCLSFQKLLARYLSSRSQQRSPGTAHHGRAGSGPHPTHTSGVLICGSSAGGWAAGVGPGRAGRGVAWVPRASFLRVGNSVRLAVVSLSPSSGCGLHAHPLTDVRTERAAPILCPNTPHPVTGKRSPAP